MNVYRVTFDATTYIVLAHYRDELLDLLFKADKGFQKEVDGGIVYMWDLKNIEEVKVEVIETEIPQIVFSISH